MNEIAPKCLTKKNAKFPSFTNEGFIIPCCECEPPSIKQEFINRGFYDPELHISQITNNNLGKIFLSEQWTKFRKDLFDDPENAPRICKEFCRKEFNDIEQY